MKTTRLIKTVLWAVVAVLAVCLTACDTVDEPQPPLNPSQENPEPWGDESPHAFYFDLDSIKLHLNNNGFLMFYTNEGYIDHIVIDSTQIFPPDMSNEKGITLNGPTNVTHFRIKGKRATPFNNVDVYKRCCLQINRRPESQYNLFPELSHLPTINMNSNREIAFDTLVYVDIITHTCFNYNHPAGSSMGLRTLIGSKLQVGMVFSIFAGDLFFQWLQPVGPYGGTYMQGLGKCNTEFSTYPGACMTLFCVGYPEKVGDYPMTMYMKFASGRTISQDFKIRFVDKK